MATVNPYESSQLPAAAQILPGGTGLMRDGDKVSIAYDIFIEDMIAFGVEHHRKSPVARRSFYIVWLVAPAMIVVGTSMAYSYSRDGSPVAMIVGLIFSVAFMIYYPLRYAPLLRRNLQRAYAQGNNSSVCGPWRLEITPERLSVFAPLVDTHCRWAAVQRVTRSADAMHIYISAVSAFIIPFRAFRDASEANEVEALINRYMVAGRGMR